MITKKKKLGIRLFAIVLPVLFAIGLILFPYLLQTDDMLMPLEFVTAGQFNDADTVTLHGIFDRHIPIDEPLWLYAENAEIQITVLGTTYNFNERGDTPGMFRSPGNGWYSFVSPGIEKGEMVEITVCSYYNQSSQAAEITLGKLYTGDGSGLIGLMLGQINFFNIVLIFAAIAGVIYMVEGAINMALGISAEGLRIALFGMYCFTGGLWSVTDALYPYFTLLITPPWAAALLDMSGLLLFPIALACVMRSYSRGSRTSRMMTCIIIAEIVTAAVCLMIQMMGRADLIEQQLMIRGIALAALCLAMVCMMLEFYRYQGSYLLLLFFTVLPVFIAEIMDGINLIWPYMPPHVLMPYSFAISILLLVLQLISYADMEFKKEETLRRMENELLQSRISIMISQIQPHFLYNALNTIRYLCRTQPEKAVDTITDFSNYLRSKMDSLTQENLILFTQEQKHIECYLNIEQARFPELRIVYDIKAEEFSLPPLTLQTLVENAVHHGAAQREDGTVAISTWEDDSAVYLKVEDDGPGFDMTQLPQDGRSHIGIINTHKRLQVMCGGSLTIESWLNKGTVAIITIPKEKEI